MADTSQQELTEPHTNGLMDGLTEEEKSKMRPADIEADVKEMERRRRVEMMMNSKLFREELERIIETQMNNGSGPSGLLQQISDMMGAQGTRFNSNVFKNSNCVMPINDIRGVESMGYAKGEKLLRCKLAAVFRLLDLYGWTQGVGGQITARLNQDHQHYLVNPYGLLYHEITASSLVKVDMQGQIVEQGTTNFGVHIGGFQLHSTIHAARPDIKCIIHITTPSVTAVSSLKSGILPIGEESIVIGEVSTHQWIGETVEQEERDKITRNLGPINKVMLLTNRGALCCGETIEEAFYNVYNTVLACETQLKLMPAGIENIALISEEAKKAIFEASRKQPVPHHSTITEPPALAEKLEKRWRIGSTEFEALMRMLDNAGFRTGYIYRHPLIKSEPPRPRNDVEVPPAVSSLGYLLEEEENYKQGLWKGGRKGFDRTHWLNSPNVYQKVEILETGTPDPKKITKWVEQNAEEWVSDGSPTHSSTPVRIDSALQFVPKNTNPKEFKVLQQQIKDNRRADKMTAGPQSHILEGVSWEEAKKMQDATMSATGESVVLVGAASKGIIQRGFQHNAMVYKTPYAKNPFDAITDQELDQYKKEVERKTKGDIYDESQSESEALSSFNISRATHESSTAKSPIQSPVSVTSETEEESRDEPRVLRIEKKQVPVPSQPEVVLSDGETHGHDKVNDTNRTVAVVVTGAPHIQQSVDVINDYPILSKAKLEADATSQFLNEMRRDALDPRNTHNKRDYLSSISDDVDMASGWLPQYQRCQTEIIKLNSVAELKKPKITEIKKNPSTNFITKKRSNSVFLAKRKFFEEYEKWYNEYRNSSRANFLRIVHENFGEKRKSLSPRNLQSEYPQNSKVFLNNEGFVKKIIVEKFSPTEEINPLNFNFSKRKRAYTRIFTNMSPGLSSKAKVPRLSLPSSIEMNDLKSPPLVNAIMKFSKNPRISKSEGNTPTSDYFLNLQEPSLNFSESSFPERLDILAEDLKISSSSEPTNSSSVVTITEVIFPQAEKVEKVDLMNADVTNDQTDPIQVSPDKKPAEAIKNRELPDENGNSLKENLSTAETEEKKALNAVFTTDWIEHTEEDLKTSFERDISDDCPWRYSSPIPKNYNREDSMTEVINTLKTNLTPSKSMTSPFLPETDTSKKYNLNPSQVSLLYSLTPTASGDCDDDENPKEHFNCGKSNCSDCLFVGYSRANSLDRNSECSNENIEYIWEEMIPSTKEDAPMGPGLRIDLNKTIDLFENSIDLETDQDLSPDGSMDNEHCSVGGSDLLELPHSTFIELEESKDEAFVQDIATSANEVIAGLGEREALVNAEKIVDDVLEGFACLNFDCQGCSTDLRTVLEAKLTALHVAKNIIDEVMDEMGLEINQELTEEKQIKEIEEIIQNSIGEDSKDGRESESPLSFIVINELIHHIIDKVASDAENTSGSSPGSFNLKKAKESANSEIKDANSGECEGYSEGKVPPVTPDLLKQVNDPEIVGETRRLEFMKSSEDLINEIKSIFNGIDIDPESEESMKEELEQIVASCCVGENGEVFSSDMEAFEHYANQMQLIAKAIVFEESLNKSKSETLDSSDSADNSLYANKSESVKRFVSRFKKITKDKKKRRSLDGTESSFSSLDMNLSLEKTIDVSSQSENQVSSLENDTKSDNSREKHLSNDKNRSSDDEVQLVEKDSEDSLTTQTQNSDDNITDDVEKNLVHMWDFNESEMEKSWNEIRGNDDSSTFIQDQDPDQDQVDDLQDDIPDEIDEVDEVQIAEVKIAEIKEKISSLPSSPRTFKPDLPPISEDEELKTGVLDVSKDRTLSPILEDEISEMKDLEASLEASSLEEVTLDCNDDEPTMKKVPSNSPEHFSKYSPILEDDFGSSERSSTADFLSCKEESSTPFQTGQNSSENSVQTRLLAPCGFENEETDSRSSTNLFSDHETYTISECSSDDCRETVYYGDVSSNLRSSAHFFPNMGFDQHDTTINFADVSSALEELEISRKKDGKDEESEEIEVFLMKCPICDSVPRSLHHQEELPILNCSYCLMKNAPELNIDEGFIKKNQFNEEISKNVEIPQKKCIVCRKFPVFTGDLNRENEVIVEDSVIIIEDIENPLKDSEINERYDVCSNCLMALSVDTREFIQMEHIISNEEHSCELIISPIPPVPDYENTTLCKIVSSMNLNKTLVDDDFIEVDGDDPICSIRMLFELC